MSRVFISYRRDDTLWQARALHEHLSRHFDVFMDVANPVHAKPFPVTIAGVLQDASAVVVLIGKEWLAPGPSGKPRIFDPGDVVCKEIEAGLFALGNVSTIPVLVDGARMPLEAELPDTIKKLAPLSAIELQNNYWDASVTNLVSTIDEGVRCSAECRRARPVAGIRGLRQWVSSVPHPMLGGFVVLVLLAFTFGILIGPRVTLFQTVLPPTSGSIEPVLVTPTPSAREQISAALILMNDGKYGEAVKMLDDIDRSDSGTPGLRAALYNVHLRAATAYLHGNAPLGDLDEAWGSYSLALRYAQGDAEATGGLCRVLEKRLLVVAPHLRTPGNFHAAHDQVAISRRELARIPCNQPGFPDPDAVESATFVAEARTSLELGALDNASREIGKALTLRPDDPAAREVSNQVELRRLWSAVETLSALNQPVSEPAILDALERVLQLAQGDENERAWSDFFHRLWRRAGQQLQRGDISASDSELARAEQAAGSNEDRLRLATLTKLNNRVSWYWGRDPQKTIDALEEMMRIDPHWPDGFAPQRLYAKLLQKADAFLAINDCREALPILLWAIELRPGRGTTVPTGTEARQRLEACLRQPLASPSPIAR